MAGWIKVRAERGARPASPELPSKGRGRIGAQLRSGGPVWVLGEACLSLRVPHMACGRCIDVCPPGAITISAKTCTMTLADGCFGCGRCVPVCPTGAVSVDGFSDELSQIATERTEAVAIDCRRVPSGASLNDGARRVPCLGGVTVDHILALYDRDDPVRVELLDRGWCGDCPAGRGENESQSGVMGMARAVLSAAGVGDALLPRAVSRPLPARAAGILSPTVETVDEGRRGLLRRATARRPDGGGVAVDLPPTSRAPIKTGPRRELLALAARLARRHGGKVAARLYPTVTINDDCRGHGACAAFCPTGALGREEVSGLRRTLFDAERCVACGFCVEACVSDAVALAAFGNGTVPEGTVEIRRATLGACPRCNAEITTSEAIPAGGGLCPRCARTMALAREGAGLRSFFGGGGDGTSDRTPVTGP